MVFVEGRRIGDNILFVQLESQVLFQVMGDILRKEVIDQKLYEFSYKGDFVEGGVGQMGKVKREFIELFGMGLVLWQNQLKF